MDERREVMMQQLDLFSQSEAAKRLPLSLSKTQEKSPCFPSEEANAWYDAMDAEYFRDTGIHIWEFSNPPEKPSDQRIAEDYESYLSYCRVTKPPRFLHNQMELSEVPSSSLTARTFSDLFASVPSLYRGRYVLWKGGSGVYRISSWSHVPALNGVGVTRINGDLTGGRDWCDGDVVPDGFTLYLYYARHDPGQWTYVAKYADVQRIGFRQCSVFLAMPSGGRGIE